MFTAGVRKAAGRDLSAQVWPSGESERETRADDGRCQDKADGEIAQGAAGGLVEHLIPLSLDRFDRGPELYVNGGIPPR